MNVLRKCTKYYVWVTKNQKDPIFRHITIMEGYYMHVYFILKVLFERGNEAGRERERA